MCWISQWYQDFEMELFLQEVAAKNWGLEYLRYEIRDIMPPHGVKAAMEMQAEAERRKRAQILESEGKRPAHFNIAFGEAEAIFKNPEQLQEILERRRERRKWTPTEDIVLCSSWLNTSKDAVVGNEQERSAFWKRIGAYFNASPKLAGFQKREASHCKQRWNKISDNVYKFVGCYEVAKRQKTSGYNDTDVLKVAYELFFHDYKVKFNLEHAWIELRNEQKWCDFLTCKGEGSSKKRKLDVQSESSHTAKAKGKSSESKSGTVENESTSLLEFQSMWIIKEKDLAMRQRLSMVGLLESLIAKKEPLSEMEVALKNKLITDMLSN